MEPESLPRKENENPDRGGAEQKKKRYWKTFRVVALFGIIEAFSLVVWIISEDVSPEAASDVRWFAACGFLAGGAYGFHKFITGKNQKFKKGAIWCVWGAVCLSLPFLKERSTDESGNPIGFLIPANDPMPDESWAPSNSCFLELGGNICAAYPNSIIPAVSFLGTNILEIGENDKGVFISGKFFDENNKLVAVLETNEWTLNNGYYFRRFPTKNSLVVTDKADREVLNVRFCNRNLIKLTGIIRLPDSTEVNVTPNGVVYSGNNNSGIRYFGQRTYGAGGFGIIQRRDHNGRNFSAPAWGTGAALHN